MLGDVERLLTPAGRVKPADALYALLDDVMSSRSTAEWLEFYQRFWDDRPGTAPVP